MFINGGETEDYGVVSNNTAFQHKDELNWQDIDGLIGKAVKDFGVELVVIDHLHYFTRELERIAEDLGRITKQFKQNAKAYDLPIMLISHVRKTENGKKATIDDLRSSSYIAQDADIVLMVEQGDPENLTQITMEKNRNRGVDRREENNVMVVKNVETKMVEQRRQSW
jgi:replicative DNA helicase